MNENNIKMYLITHKEIAYIPNGRTPLFVGEGDNPQKFMTDREGDSIAEKNESYCELTAMYSIWKNDRTSEYVSIEHYRRFFMKKHSLQIAENMDIMDYLEKSDIVTTQYYDYKITNYE